MAWPTRITVLLCMICDSSLMQCTLYVQVLSGQRKCPCGNGCRSHLGGCHNQTIIYSIIEGNEGGEWRSADWLAWTDWSGWFCHFSIFVLIGMGRLFCKLSRFIGRSICEQLSVVAECRKPENLYPSGCLRKSSSHSAAVPCSHTASAYDGKAKQTILKV